MKFIQFIIFSLVILSTAHAVEIRPDQINWTLSDYYSIDAFGAVADNTTNCTTAIQGAIDAAPSTGGVVLIPPGKYYSGGKIDGKSNIEIRFAAGAQIYYPGTDYALRFYDATRGGVTEFSIDRPNIYAPNGTAIELDGFWRCSIREPYLTAYKGIKFRNGNTAIVYGGGKIVHERTNRREAGSIGLDMNDTAAEVCDVTIQVNAIDYFDHAVVLGATDYSFGAYRISLSACLEGNNHGVVIYTGIGHYLTGCYFESQQIMDIEINNTGTLPPDDLVLNGVFFGGTGKGLTSYDYHSGIYIYNAPYTGTYTYGDHTTVKYESQKATDFTGIGKSPIYPLDTKGRIGSGGAFTNTMYPFGVVVYGSFSETANSSNALRCVYVAPQISIANGKTVTGSFRGSNYAIMRNYNPGIVAAVPDGNGTLSQLVGDSISYGHYNTVAGMTPITTDAFGLYITPYIKTGTITNMYDIYLGATSTGGTATNSWGIYQANTKLNYFAGDVSADDVVDRTPGYDGNALDELSKVKTKNGKIDHSTLPAFARKKIKSQDAKGNVIEEEGRSLGAMISIQTKAIQQLTERIEALEKKTS